MKKIKNLFKESADMTVGNPTKLIILFMIPMLIGNIAQQMYNTVDSIIVGRYVGDNALAAVGSVGSIFNLVTVLFIGISVGVSIVVAQYVGAKDRQNITYTIGSCFILLLISSLLLMIIGPMISRPLLQMLNTPDAILDWSVSYLNIMLLGISGMAFYNILCGIMRGMGDSISPLKYLLIATILNIILDFVFVVYLDLQVAGVALATIIAQMVSAILCIKKLFSMHDVFDFHFKDIRFHKAQAMSIIKLGLPAGLTQMIFSLALVVMQPLSNSHGEMFIASNIIVMRVDGFAMMPSISFGTALTTFVGQNVGAKKFDRIIEGAKKGTIVALITSIIITTLLLLFGRSLIAIFTKTPALIDLSMELLIILSLGYLAMAITQSLSGVMRGAGDTISPMWISIISSVIIRVPLAYILTDLTKTPDLPHGLSHVLYISLLISWIIGAILSIIVYNRKKWLKIAINSKKEVSNAC